MCTKMRKLQCNNKYKCLASAFVILVCCVLDNNADTTESQEPKTKSSGKFWQITDIHWDLRYSRTGDPRQMCHGDDGGVKINGEYGSYFCDSPWPLVQLTINQMAIIDDKPDFILWTGDTAPHTNDPEPDFAVIFKTMKNISSEIQSTFAQSTPILPVLGNHDAYPKDEYPAKNTNLTAFYNRYLVEGGWKDLIPKEQHEDFKKGGFYSYDYSDDITIIVLNTNLYYAWNKLGTSELDPCGQFEWLETKFNEARNLSNKVIVAAHSPPGYFERNALEPFFNSTYNKAYVNLMNKYADVILAQIYGHLHTDTFRIFSESEDDLKSAAFIAPSVTPWHPSMIDGATGINPSLRLYTYNSSFILDYMQYHIDLSKTYFKNETTDNEPKWLEYYQATKLFTAEVLDVYSMARFARKLETNSTLFQEYFIVNSAGVVNGPCDNKCKQSQLCAINHMHISEVSKCMQKNSTSHGHKAHFSHMSHVTAGTLIHATRPVGGQVVKRVPHIFIAIIVCSIASIIIVGVMAIIFVVRRNRILGNRDRLAQFEWNYRQEGYRLLNVDNN